MTTKNKRKLICEKEKYVSLDEFSRMIKVQKKTIIKNRKKIPVIIGKKGRYIVLEGTRYPAVISKFTLNDIDDKRYALLRIINQEKYVDHAMLGLYKKAFNLLLAELLQANLIMENGMCNKYGANAYSCTILGSEVLKKRKASSKKQIVSLIASGTGTFIGSIISEVYPIP